MKLCGFMLRALAAVNRFASDYVRDCVLVEPIGFLHSTGERVASESRANVRAFIGSFRPREWDLVNTQPGDDKVLLLASEVGTITPAAGLYLLEGLSGIRRDIVSARLDPTGAVWRLVATQTANEDLGDLSTATASEDLGDLTLATSASDLGGIV
jgi:hypothetical protein